MTKKSFKDDYKESMKQSHDTKDKGGVQGKRWYDLSKLEDESIEMYKPKLKKNMLDVIPFEVQTNILPGLPKGKARHMVDVYVHRSVGPAKKDDFLCPEFNLKKKCPICEYFRELQEEGEDWDVLKKYRPQRRTMFNVIDLTAEGKKKIQLFEVSHNRFEKEIQEEAESNSDGESIVYFDPEDGKTVSFKGVEKTFNNREYIDIKNVSLEEREEQYKESIIEKAYSLDKIIVIPTYQEIYDTFYAGGSIDEENKKEDEDDGDEDEKGKVQQMRKREKETEEKDDEDDEKPTSKKTVKGKCTYGHVFGKDCDQHDECEDCDAWDECSDEHASLKKSKITKKGSSDDEDDDE